MDFVVPEVFFSLTLSAFSGVITLIQKLTPFSLRKVRRRILLIQSDWMMCIMSLHPTHEFDNGDFPGAFVYSSQLALTI